MKCGAQIKLPLFNIVIKYKQNHFCQIDTLGSILVCNCKRLFNNTVLLTLPIM